MLVSTQLKTQGGPSANLWDSLYDFLFSGYSAFSTLAALASFNSQLHFLNSGSPRASIGVSPPYAVVWKLHTVSWGHYMAHLIFSPFWRISLVLPDAHGLRIIVSFFFFFLVFQCLSRRATSYPCYSWKQ